MSILLRTLPKRPPKVTIRRQLWDQAARRGFFGAAFGGLVGLAFVTVGFPLYYGWTIVALGLALTLFDAFRDIEKSIANYQKAYDKGDHLIEVEETGIRFYLGPDSEWFVKWPAMTKFRMSSKGVIVVMRDGAKHIFESTEFESTDDLTKFVEILRSSGVRDVSGR